MTTDGAPSSIPPADDTIPAEVIFAETRAKLKAELLAELRAEFAEEIKRLPGKTITWLPRPGEDGDLPTKYDGLIELRAFANEHEMRLNQQVSQSSWPNISPKSTLVCVIGNHYDPGSWQHITDMIKFTGDNGVRCGLSEIQDRCFNPYDALGTMRNEALLKALYEGWQYICYLDADVHPEPDALLKLLARDLPIVAPLVVEPATGRKLHGPERQAHTGLQPVRWCVLSMLLFQTNVFRCFASPSNFWEDAIGADEGFHFQKLWEKAHRPMLDTDVQLLVSGKPHYPLASLRFKKSEYERFWDDSQAKRKLPPDRKPIKLDDPHVLEGAYNPFVVPGSGTAPLLASGQPQSAIAGGVVVPQQLTNAAPAEVKSVV